MIGREQATVGAEQAANEILVVNFDANKGAPEPLDEKIRQGIPLNPSVDAVKIVRTTARLRRHLDAVGQDDLKESGSCIAYGYDVDEGTLTEVDARLIRVAKSRIMTIPFEADAYPNVSLLWSGRSDQRIHRITRFMGPLLLNDGTSPHGVVYTLLSGLAPRT